MKRIIAFFIKYPIYANAIIIITAICGILSISIMPRSFFPEMTPNKIFINVSYPGASPQEIEEGITTKIEESLNGIQGVKEITSSSSENYCRINVETYEGYDIDEALQDVKSSVDAIYSFPSGAEKPIIQKQKSRGMGGIGNIVGFYSLNGPDDLWRLKEVSDKIEQDLLNKREISQLTVNGYAPIIIAIEINENKLLTHNITFDMISSSIRSSNIDMSAGSIKTNQDEIIIRSNNRSNKVEEIEEIIIYSNPNGDVVRLKDIADVRLDFSDVPLKSFVDDKRSISFIVLKTPDEDLTKIANVTQSYIKNFNKNNPDFKIITIFQFSDLLDQRIATLSENLLIGLLLVCIVLGLFLSLRLSL